jgi:hypothetical protein
MKPIFSDEDPARTGYVQSILENAGIPTFFRNRYTHNTMGMFRGQVPPVLCVVDDNDFEKATTLIAEFLSEAPTESLDWTCTECDESVPGNFDICWKCGAEHNDSNEANP